MSKRVITVTSIKKDYETTDAVLFGVIQSMRGHKVLLIDINPDGNLSTYFGWNGEGYTINNILSESVSDTDAYKFVSEYLSYIPADKEALSTLDEKLQFSEGNLLKSFIDKLNNFDKIIFDCSPTGSNILTRKAVELSDNVIVCPPVAPQFLNDIHLMNEELKELCAISAKQ